MCVYWHTWTISITHRFWSPGEQKYVECSLRSFSAFETGLWMHQAQEIAGDDCTVGAILLYSDKTMIGNVVAYPLYSKFMNVHVVHRTFMWIHVCSWLVSVSGQFSRGYQERERRLGLRSYFTCAEQERWTLWKKQRPDQESSSSTSGTRVCSWTFICVHECPCLF